MPPKRIAILKTGAPPKDLRVPSYAQMIRDSLGPDRYVFEEFDVTRSELPSSSLDAYIVTGSASGVHDTDAWIARLRAWLVDLHPRLPIVGICFGQQIMAQAYGGRVETCPRGWGVGLHEYRIGLREMWMDAQEDVALPAFHRDQVVEPPPASTVLAGSDFCPNAMLSYEERRAVSFQAHPEFPLDYAAMLVERGVRNGIIDPTQADLARASLRRPNDCARVCGWISRFLSVGINEDDA